MRILILILFLFPAITFAQDAPSTTLSNDTSKVEVRIPDEGVLQSYADNNDFKYDTEVAQTTSFWHKLLFWFLNLLDRAFENKISGTLIKTVFILIFLAVVLLLINQLMQGNLRPAFLGKNTSKKISLNMNTEHIELINLDELIARALEQKNYHDALRFTYHKALQKLSESELILWGRDKTNHEYLTEIGDHPVKLPFNRLTTIYDYVEYGDFEFDEYSYNKAADVYTLFEKQLGAGK